MTREELAKKNGIKLPPKKQSPAETLITSPKNALPDNPEKNKSERNDTTQDSSEKPSTSEKMSAKKYISKSIQPVAKRGPGKPKKRKPGDRQISFWLDEDLVPGLFSTLSYGDSVGNHINDIIRAYQKKNGLYQK